ncbi:DctP family TRAP transporter solute-binding subunit [Propionivibrio dicarboxylicus]|uniref:Tripartite ATP-independent transporter solute receptor, DctP family n=1 Tax=Propionivibrio dicarboxylicus TaxID=83767 RepID=A0A1G7Z2B9_9RHOO|nr:DctP family TRAP transporter solute-binding subunit [Propionivibrio dicarboxylicus]SDH02794.1 tripartite ATP-independent transporter solute receptor, DctP family [Propionivibrio dicarboxylicus]
MNLISSLSKCLFALSTFALVNVSHADIRPHTFKFAHVLSKASHYEAGAQKFAEILAKKSNNKLIIKTYPDGTLGGEVQVIQALRSGTVDITTCNPGMLIGLNKNFGVFDMPFMFNDHSEADAILDGRIGKSLLDNPPPGLVGLAYWDHGFRNVSNSKRPIVKMEDIDGLKIRVSQSPMIIETIRGLNANPLPMPFTELYTALETKAVDGQENPNGIFEFNKLYEVQKYLSLTQHQYNPLIVLFSKKIWDELNSDEQKLVREAAAETVSYQRKFLRDMNSNALVSLKEKGTIINDVSAQEKERMRNKLRPVSERLAKEQVNEAIVKDVMAELEKIRQTKTSN